MEITYDESTTNDYERASRLEWLETNGLGGWASSTVAGAHTRRYHGVLVAATHPPVGRMVLLSRLDETVIVAGERIELGASRFPGAVHPQGFRHLKRFVKGTFPVFEFEAGPVRLRKTIAAVHGENTTVVAYEVVEARSAFTLELRPFVACRDYHALTRANPYLRASATYENGVFRTQPYDGTPELFLGVPRAAFVAAPDWYRNFEYAVEQERGLDFQEDLFTPGTFVRELKRGDRFAVVVSTDDPTNRDGLRLIERERKRREALIAGLPAEDRLRRTLTVAADQFVVRRGADLRTIVAGYPWFTDWGRDTMIALPGLTLATGRDADAKRILRAFVDSVSEGMLPNRFPDAGEEPEYNTVDATLWLFVAVHEYIAATSDESFVLEEIVPVLENIVAWHETGTRHGIRADEDGLLRAGAPGVQLTWMDAKVGDWVVTPRHGKPVEVNALWYNALVILADLLTRAGRTADGKAIASRAKRVKERFADLFWNAEAGYLFDVVDDDRRDAAIRPNAVLALALPHALLTREQARLVLQTAEDKLLTPVGLRSLAPEDPGYRPVYVGGPAYRDAAYHQGTVWSWLLGPYALALVRAYGAPGRARARRVLEGIVPHLGEAGIGTVSEIFDGDPPHAPRGCYAQAWSVGELLRAWVAVTSEARTSPRKAASSERKRPYKIVPVKTKPSAARRKPPEASR